MPDRCDSCILGVLDNDDKWVLVCGACRHEWRSFNPGPCPSCSSKNVSVLNATKMVITKEKNELIEAAALAADKAKQNTLAQDIRDLKKTETIIETTRSS